ncbi:MAG TPA: hypothetical protein VKB29_04065 [Candidatus Binataceae bacterium]|nr:hypothetical protein [Candidatus Binataceae bacterium]
MKAAQARFIVKIVAGFTFIPCALAIAQHSTLASAAPVGILRVKPKKTQLLVESLQVFIENQGRPRDNVGNADLTVIFGNETLPFKVACSCTKEIIAPKQSVAALIAFQPTAPGKYTATFSIESDAGKGPVNITLALTGIAKGQAPSSSAAVEGN